MSEQPETTRVEAARNLDRRPRLALVLWNGNVGGAEILNANLAVHMRRLGATVTVVFVGNSQPLAERLLRSDIPYRSLNLSRGREVLRHPRLYAKEVTRCGSDGALVLERGFMGAALRVGGYRGAIVAVEHGMLLLEQQGLTKSRRLLRRGSRLGGAWATNAEVAVSDFMLDRMRQQSHARRSLRIYNGIDPDTYLQIAEKPADRGPNLVVGFVGRLIHGKGTDHLVRALARASRQIPARLLIAGDGPERSPLELLVRELSIDAQVEFLGVVEDLTAFWQKCDVAVVPSENLESFSMATLEAMACGKPIVATRSGAIPELVVDGITGTLVTPGNIEDLAQALFAYTEQPELRREHGAAARARAVERFHINACAQAYLDLFGELATRPTTRGSAPTSAEGR